MGKIITVASGKGGTGKTTTVAAVSSSLAALGYRTICVDFDVGLRNLDLALGMSDYAIADFVDVVSGRMALMEACSECPRIRGLFFLAAPAFLNQSALNEYAILRMLEEIRDEFDFCLIDAPAGIAKGFSLAHLGADMSIIVTLAEIPAIKDAQRAVEEARGMDIEEIRLLVNRAHKRRMFRTHITVDDVIDMVGAQLIGVVREDPAVSKSLFESIPLILHKRRLAAYDFLDTARRITGEDLPLVFRRMAYK